MLAVEALVEPGPIRGPRRGRVDEDLESLRQVARSEVLDLALQLGLQSLQLATSGSWRLGKG